MKKQLILISVLAVLATTSFCQDYSKKLDLTKYGIPITVNALPDTKVDYVTVNFNMSQGEYDFGTSVSVIYKKENEYDDLEKERGRALLEAGKKNIVLEEEYAVIIKKDNFITVNTYHPMNDGWYAIATAYPRSEEEAKKLAEALKPKK